MTKKVKRFIFGLIIAITAMGQNWEFMGAFPDNSGWPQSYGSGIAVDGEGKIWYTSYYNSETVMIDTGSGTADYEDGVRAIYVFNPDGTQAGFSPITEIMVDGVNDTLQSSNRGLRTDQNGDIIAGSWGVYYRINHLTGEGMDKLLPYPRPETEDLWAGESLIAAAVDADGNMYCNPVVCSAGPIKAFDSEWELIADLVPVDMLNGYSRTIEVAPDGSAIYHCNFTGGYGLVRFNSSTGDVYGDFTTDIDTLFPGLSVEATSWDPAGRLWLGNTGGAGFTNAAFYAFDPETDTMVDSIIFPASIVDLGVKPRGIDFSADGQTAYITFFNTWESDAIYVYQSGQANFVSFNVNMGIQESLGRFNPTQDQIEVRGDFNGWVGDSIINMTETGNTGLYTATVDFSAYEAESNHEYKFVIVKPDQDIWESRSNRIFTYNGIGMHLPTVWFNDVSSLEQTAPWSITIGVSGGNLSDLNNVFGTQSDATIGYDADVDLPEPPLPPSEYLQLYFPHPEWEVPIGPNFTTDYRTAVDMINSIFSWDFEVATDLVETTITLDFSDAMGVPYVMTYFLEDLNNGVIQDLNTNPVYTYNSGTGGITQFRVSIGETLASQLSHMFDPGWHMFSLPLETGTSLADDLLGPFSAQPFYVYGYDLESGYAIAPELFQGQGYWLANLEPMDVQVTGIADTSSFSASLALGWNLIGNPFSYAKPLNAVSIEYDGQIVDFNTAVGNGWVASSLYGFDGASYVEETQLSPWGGYWLSALVENLTLHLNFFEDEATVLVRSDERSEEEWYLSIIAEQGSNADLITQIGVHPDATTGFDAYFDAPEPPPLPTGSHLSTYFVHSNWNEVLGSRYNRDIRGPIYMDEQEVWQLTIQSDPGEVVLSWEYDTEAIPEYMHLLVMDINHGVIVDMTNQENYQFNNSNGESIFLITALRNLVGVENISVPTEYMLSQNYPNPFNPMTTISYSLPEQTRVKLTVFDIRGQEVMTLQDAVKPPGNYKVQWSGIDQTGNQVSTGVYFCRLNAGAYTKTIKMVYLQ